MEKLISVLAVIVAAVAVIVASMAYMAPAPEAPVVPTAEEIASLIVIPVPEVVENSDLNEFLEDALKDKREAELKNDTAKELVLSEIDLKSFRVALMDLLNDEGRDVDSYRDISVTSVVVKESSVAGDSAVVVVELRVSFIEFGDSEESFRAVIEAVFEVEGLDVEELEDAEVVDYDLELLRVREN
jgi:hypothetical protein